MGIQSNLIAENSCLHCCEKAGEWDWTLQGLRKLVASSMQPSPTSTSAVISAAEKSFCWPLVLTLVACGQCDQILLNGAINALAGHWQLASICFTSMTERKFLLDQTSFSSAMTAYAPAEEWTSTLALLSNLRTLFQPDFIRYLDALLLAQRSIIICIVRPGSLAFLLAVVVGLAGSVSMLSLCATRDLSNIFSEKCWGLSAAMSALEKAGRWKLALCILGLALMIQLWK